MKAIYTTLLVICFAGCAALTPPASVETAAVTPETLVFTTVDTQEPGIAVLVYHQINDTKQPGETIVPTRSFEQQMRYLAANGYQIISMSELAAIIAKQKPAPEKAVVITFDDGWSSVLSVTPTLTKMNLKASFWIIVDQVSTDDDSEFLSWNQLKHLIENPIFEVESHTMTHPLNENDDLVAWMAGTSTKHTEADAKDEIIKSKQILEQKLNTSIEYLSWPGGRYNEALIQIAKDAGYKGSVTIDDGGNQAGDSMFTIKRLFVSGKCNLAQFDRLMKTHAATQCEQ